MHGWIGSLLTIDSTSIVGSADAAQKFEPPSQFTTAPFGEKALESALASPKGECERIMITTGLFFLMPRVASDFIGHLRIGCLSWALMTNSPNTPITEWGGRVVA
jgi:hypothetical protein